MIRTLRRISAAVVVAAVLPAASPAAAQSQATPVAEATVVVARPGDPSRLVIKLTDLLVSSATTGSTREPASVDLTFEADESVALLLPAVQKAREAALRCIGC